MKKNQFKKAFTIIAASASALILSQFALANTPTNSGNNPTPSPAPFNANGIIAAINHVGDEMVSLGTAAAKEVNSLMYQYDKNLPSTMQSNTATVKNQSINQIASQGANKATENNLISSLNQIAYAVTPPKQGTAAYQQQLKYQKENSPTALSTGVAASDTLYTSADNEPYLAQTLGVAKPKTTHDDYFNFATLFSPQTYNSEQEQAAKHYVKYTTKDYESLTNDVNLSQLQGQPPSVLKQFVDSDTYKQYQLDVRSSLATRSLVLSNYNYLIAERTPVKGLGTAAGLKNAKGKVIANASPLQVESYIANRKVNSKQWYRDMAAASPATIARETLFTLAEIEHQNFQAHLDRERILATLNTLEAQNSSVNQLLAKENANKLNELIGKLTGNKGSGDDNLNNLNPNQQQKLKEEEQKIQQQEQDNNK